MSKPSPSSPERRSFFTRFNAGVTSLAAVAIGGIALAQEKPKVATRWEPARHGKDDWWDELPGKHRLVIDTTSSNGLAEGLAFAGNFINVNRSDYGVESNNLAVVIIARHRSTPFAYNDAIWSKYGTNLATLGSVEDPKSKLPPKVNMYNSTEYGNLLGNRGTTLDSLTKQGVQVAVCSVATRGLAGLIARAVGGNADMINSELIANLVTNGRMVPAGIVAVSRAQERGYTLAST